MSLPDIDTTQVSFISYWNVLVHGVGDSGPDSWDPSTVTSAGIVNSYTSYSNGVEGTLSLDHGRNDAKFRAKDDGWMVVYIDRSEDSGTKMNKVPRGPYDFMYHKHDEAYYKAKDDGSDYGPATLHEDAHTRALEKLYNASGISGDASVSWTPNKVGHYNYQHTGTNVSVMGTTAVMNNWSSGLGHETFYPEFSFSDDMNVAVHWVTGAGSSNPNGGYHLTVGGTNAPETELLYDPYDQNTEYTQGAALRAAGIDYAQNTGVTYTAYVRARTDNSDYEGATNHHNQLVIWS